MYRRTCHSRSKEAEILNNTRWTFSLNKNNEMICRISGYRARRRRWMTMDDGERKRERYIYSDALYVYLLHLHPPIMLSLSPVDYFLTLPFLKSVNIRLFSSGEQQVKQVSFAPKAYSLRLVHFCLHFSYFATDMMMMMIILFTLTPGELVYPTRPKYESVVPSPADCRL